MSTSRAFLAAFTQQTPQARLADLEVEMASQAAKSKEVELEGEILVTAAHQLTSLREHYLLHQSTASLTSTQGAGVAIFLSVSPLTQEPISKKMASSIHDLLTRLNSIQRQAPHLNFAAAEKNSEELKRQLSLLQKGQSALDSAHQQFFVELCNTNITDASLFSLNNKKSYIDLKRD